MRFLEQSQSARGRQHWIRAGLTIVVFAVLAGFLILSLEQTKLAQKAEQQAEVALRDVASGTVKHVRKTNLLLVELANATAQERTKILSREMRKGVAFMKVTINGHSITEESVPVFPGSDIKVEVQYFTKYDECPRCIAQILVGFSHTKPSLCIYSGMPGGKGHNKSSAFTIQAPSEPGIYFLGHGRTAQYNCPKPKDFPEWATGILGVEPRPDTANGRQFAVIIVSKGL